MRQRKDPWVTFTYEATGEYSFEKKDRHPLFRRKRIQKQGMVTWIGVCTNIGIWSKMFLHASNTSEQLQQDMTN